MYAHMYSLCGDIILLKQTTHQAPTIGTTKDNQNDLKNDLDIKEIMTRGLNVQHQKIAVSYQ